MMKQHPVYSNIFVEKNGDVFSLGKNYKSPKLLKPTVSDDGYYRVNVQVSLYNQKKKGVHRLVAETFLPNPHNYTDVHHKDENPSNNSLSNLEWCSHKKNVRYSRHNIGRNKATHWRLLEVATGKEFDIFNLSEWCEKNNINRANLHKTKGTTKSAKGYRVLEKLD